MAKTGRAPVLRVVEPGGPITEFPRPVAVEFRTNYEVPFQNPDGDHIQTGWALAYTRTAGLVAWIDFGRGSIAWLPAAHIRRT